MLFLGYNDDNLWVRMLLAVCKLTVDEKWQGLRERRKMKGLKRIKLGIALLLSTITLFAGSACGLFKKGDKCDHSWDNYLAKAPTCTTIGLLERICSNCGKKEYEDIQASGHSFFAGYCTVCGVQGSSDLEVKPVPMPAGANNQAMWSMEKIYETAQTIADFDGYNDFLNGLSDGSLEEIYFDQLGIFHSTASILSSNGNKIFVPLALIVGRVSPENTEESKLGNVYSVMVKNGQLMIQYTDGVQVSAGFLIEQRLNQTSTVKGFGINVKNELVIYYSDNKIAFAGKVVSGDAPANQAGFVYMQVAGGYSITRITSEEEVVIIPVSHQGKTIVSIDNYAFGNMSGNVRKIVIPSGVSVRWEGIYSLASFVNIFFEGKRSDYDSGISSYRYAYFAGEWEYVNGIPQVK